MELTKRFYKDPDGSWYIDLPEYIRGGYGTKDDLQMVSGADDMLEKLAEGKDEITVSFSDEVLEGYVIQLIQTSSEDVEMEYVDEDDGEYDDDDDLEGFYHYQEHPDAQPVSVWLCPVTMYVFGGIYPGNIYIRISN